MGNSILRFSGKLCDYTKPAMDQVAKGWLGGKGAGLVMMAQMGLNVPPGFTIPTAHCKAYMALSPALREKFIDDLMTEVMDCMGWLEGQFGYMPLVSVRSGAPVSMPGMLDTILNIGLCNANYKEWENRIGSRATLDSDRRLTQMLGSTGYGVPMEVFDFQLAKVKKDVGAKLDTDLDELGLSSVISAYRVAFEKNKGFKFPFTDPYVQLKVAIKAVFDSWMNPRAIEYRKLNKLSDDMGTAVNVQAMVFGNMGEDSGTGVLFTRNPSTGANFVMGEFLTNAQGEDVVAGIRTPMSLDKMMDLHLNEEHEADNPAGNNLWCLWPGIRQQLVLISSKLEKAYKDMVDLEFTVQKGELFILQSRVGKRSARAAFKIAVDLVGEGVVDRKTALTRLTADQFKAVRRPMIDPAFKEKPHFIGLPACPGVAVGRPVFSAKEAVEATDPVILVTHETNPDDIAGMAKAIGILTQTGGATSHAAVVARAMDKPCVVGCTELVIDKQLIGGMKTGGVILTNADVTIDGATGNVWVGVEVPVIDASDDPAVKDVTNWCFEALNAADSVPVGGGMLRHQCVRAAYWWGNEVVLDAVLADLADLPSREHVMLDLTPPYLLTPPVDADLDACFGQTPQVGFVSFAVAELLSRKGALKGLRIEPLALGNVQVQQLGDAGFKIGWNSGQKPMPADFAVFTAFSR